MGVQSKRNAPESATIGKRLGLLEKLRGTWEGVGFNLIARPDREGGSPLFLELNQTFETLSFIPIGGAIPNRGSAVNDIEMFGLTYLQKVTDSVSKGGLHIEPGIWAHVPTQDADVTQSVFRLGTIPHGNALLAQGVAISVPSLRGNTFDPGITSAVNTAPFGVNTPMPAPGTLGGFPQYDLSDMTAASVNFRTPFGDTPTIPLPDFILGVPMQNVIANPALLLTAAISGQNIKEMVVITIATVPSIQQAQPNNAPPKTIIFNGGGGGLANIPFVQRNADAATVFATFWIETIAGPTSDTEFLQLQYVQTVLLNFPVIVAGKPPGPNLSWPHVSVATLQKTFGGQ